MNRVRPGREHHLPGPGTQQATTTDGKANPTWKVWAEAHPPAGRRRRWLLIVLSCPTCSGVHHHFGGPGGGVRRSGCGTDYELVVHAEAVAA